MARIQRLLLDPPILNSSCLWASTRVQLDALYMSDWTGGVTTRTATTLGFVEDTAVHKVLTTIFVFSLTELIACCIL